MLVLITYDVSTITPEGQKRLRLIAKECINYGQRVQNSVFECLITPADFVKLKSKLESIADKKTDSIRYYYLGSNWKRRVEHYGAKVPYDPEGAIIL